MKMIHASNGQITSHTVNEAFVLKVSLGGCQIVPRCVLVEISKLKLLETQLLIHTNELRRMVEKKPPIDLIRSQALIGHLLAGDFHCFAHFFQRCLPKMRVLIAHF